MIVSTTPSLEGKKITQYHGLVTGEAIVGANILKDWFASITDVIGGRASQYEKSLRTAKDLAVAEMVEQAERLGANAVVGVDLDYETIGKESSMLMVSASGTAVSFVSNQQSI